MKKSGFFKRLIAAFIDAILFMVLGASFHNGGVGALWVIYETILISQWGGYTVGKKVLGIRVVSTNGEKVDLLKAFIRSISQILSSLLLGLGYLWMLWDKDSQTWHDKIADTFVVEG